MPFNAAVLFAVVQQLLGAFRADRRDIVEFRLGCSIQIDFLSHGWIPMLPFSEANSSMGQPVRWRLRKLFPCPLGLLV